MNINESQSLRAKLQAVYQIQARETELLGELDRILNDLEKCFAERVFLVQEFGPEANMQGSEAAAQSEPKDD